VIIVLDGSGTIAELDVTRGDALLVPHAAGSVIAEGDLIAIVCRPPDVKGPGT
jgi:mannose-6-phosphate isomerase